MEAVKQNTALEHEIDETAEEEFQLYEQDEARRTHDYKVRKARQTSALVKEEIKLAGKTYFAEAGSIDDKTWPRPELVLFTPVPHVLHLAKHC